MRTRSASIEGRVDCSICLNPLEVVSAQEGQRCYHIQPCSHSFHRECIERWLAVNPRCPICRTPVETEGNFNPVDQLIIDHQPLANTRVTIVDVTSNQAVARAARRANSIASRVFGWP